MTNVPFPQLFTADQITSQSPEQPQPQSKLVDHFAVVRNKFPRIAESIRILWGEPELQKYLADLIFDDQHYKNGQSRQGFPTDVMESLLAIYDKHSKGAPITDIWLDAR